MYPVGDLRQDTTKGIKGQRAKSQSQKGTKLGNFGPTQINYGAGKALQNKESPVRSINDGGSSLATAQVLGQLVINADGNASNTRTLDKLKGKISQKLYRAKTLNLSTASPVTLVPSSSSSQFQFSSSNNFAGTRMDSAVSADLNNNTNPDPEPPESILTLPAENPKPNRDESLMDQDNMSNVDPSLQQKSQEITADGKPEPPAAGSRITEDAHMACELGSALSD